MINVNHFFRDTISVFFIRNPFRLTYFLQLSKFDLRRCGTFVVADNYNDPAFSFNFLLWIISFCNAVALITNDGEE